MDPDFMKSGNVDRPFAPAQERSLLHWTATLLAMLALVYGGYRVLDWWRDSPAKPLTKQAAPLASQQARPQAYTPPQPASPPTPAPGTRIVTKCVVKGQTLYNDDACPQGVTSANVVTKANHNLMPGLTAEQMAAADRIQPAAPSLSAFAQSGNSPSSSAVACKELDEYIKYLDALARQPQSMQTQDWIREEKKKARDQQVRIPCR